MRSFLNILADSGRITGRLAILYWLPKTRLVQLVKRCHNDIKRAWSSLIS